METFTICYSGTDCYLDQSLVLRRPKEMNSYNPESGYIPSKIHNRLSNVDKGYPLSVTLNGCGGPYNETREHLPIRLWDIADNTGSGPLVSGDYYAECSLPPNISDDSISGHSLELIAIAGIAMMFGVTFHLVPLGNLDQIKEHWHEKGASGYTLDDLACPESNSRWNNNVLATVGHYCIRWSKQDDEKINAFLTKFNTVALLGHSRGGVACIIAANYLAEWFKTLSIKIIALDPVPGTGNWWSCLTTIPGQANTEYVGIYAIDETSAGFNGVVPKVKAISQSTHAEQVWDPLDPNKQVDDFKNWNISNYELLYTRGRHATVPGSRSAYGNGDSDTVDDSVGASGNLANAYVNRKLSEWGVPLSLCDQSDIVQWMSQVNNNSAHFKEMRNHNYGPANALGKVNGFFFYNARGISSTSGRNGTAWNYLEAFITYASSHSSVQDYNGEPTLDSDEINSRRGLINTGVRAKYYEKFAGTGRVHPWVYLVDRLKQ